jgi:hypothetical protein
MPGLLPENLTVFIAVPSNDSPLNDVQQLGKWGGASNRRADKIHWG